VWVTDVALQTLIS